MRPSFDPVEEYLIASYRLQYQKGAGGAIGHDIATLVVFGGLLAVGLSSGEPVWTVIGIGLILYRFIQWIASVKKYGKALASIIEKYEVALSEQKPGKPAEAEASAREVGAPLTLS